MGWLLAVGLALEKYEDRRACQLLKRKYSTNYSNNVEKCSMMTVTASYTGKENTMGPRYLKKSFPT